MSKPFQAILSGPRKGRDCWRLFIVLLGTPDPWPQYDWRAGGVPPTLPERDAALAHLGYQFADDGESWSWAEIQFRDDPVELSATAQVKIRERVA